MNQAVLKQNKINSNHPHKLSKKLRKNWLWMLIIPAVAIRAITMLYPVIVTFVYSFMDYRVVKGIKEWGGLTNYIRLLNDPSVGASLQFTLIFTVCSMALIIVLGIAFGLLLNAKFKGRKFLRSIALIPWAMPTIVIGIAMLWGFNGTYGFVDDMISKLIGQPFNFNWLSDKAGAQFAVIIVDVWKNVPFFAVMVLAALQSIPNELYEAAHVDGANAFHCFFHITLPSIRSTLITMGIFFTLWRISSFDLVYAMTAGGPGTATNLISYKLFQETIKNLNYGYSSAIAVVLFMIMLVIAASGMWAQKKLED